MNTVLRHLRRVAFLDRGEGPSDGQLLEAFVTRRDEAAFAALLRRHGPMVFGVCRRVLGNRHDAEDAFQATFLVLVRKAEVIRPRVLVGNWLHGVAYRTALNARSLKAKRRAKERKAQRAERSEVPAMDEVLERLDEALGRLPERYRVPVVLCELEGRSRKEVARTLGLAEGTLSWRLAQARKMLARKLSRHGGALATGAVTAVLTQGAASASLSPSLLTATTKVGLQLAAGQALAGSVPARVAALTDGMMRAMLLTKLKVATWAVGVALLVGVGAVGVTYRAAGQQPTTLPRNNSGGNGEAPGRALTPTPQGGRPAADDVESLRLELEALRREVRATREQVKALQAEVRGLKGQAAGSSTGGLGRVATVGELPRNREPLPKDRDKERLPKDPGVVEALAQAEEALKRLRQDPSDKQAAEALERALGRLKERPDSESLRKKTLGR
jgi:RNA polymerase sigma factor (sigma-70 family)